ncbi:transmembrane protein, putative [Medicago truncatula]|uniref:Transmembrane protein, putative n=1 Tax=Medicago truncatula TaxID=3880 RepID=G7K4A6_MEDTR|nr:transmembrane protein, putative [Medicago truncatula]
MSSTWDIFRIIFVFLMSWALGFVVVELICFIVPNCYKIFIKWWRSPSPVVVAPQPVNEVQMGPV